MAGMRTAYREHLEAFNRDLLQMCDTCLLYTSDAADDVAGV